MANLAISIFLLLGYIVAGTIGGGILCVTCDSLNDKTPGDCEKRPPSASPCYAAGVKENCVKVIEYNADNTQRRFVRDCTALPDGSSCSIAPAEAIAAGAAAKICHDICNVDRCNASVRLGHSSVLSLSLLCMAFVHLCLPSIRL